MVVGGRTEFIEANRRLAAWSRKRVDKQKNLGCAIVSTAHGSVKWKFKQFLPNFNFFFYLK